MQRYVAKLAIWNNLSFESNTHNEHFPHRHTRMLLKVLESIKMKTELIKSLRSKQLSHDIDHENF